MNFADLRLAEPILKSLAAEGYLTPTPIQAQAIPHVLQGRDVLGCAQTGTGKTAAFAAPILHRLAATPTTGPRHPRCLVVCPTRELATQIGQSFAVYGAGLRLQCTVIFGGVGQGRQTEALRRGVDIIVATPGRLLDLMNQGFVDLRGIKVLVLDEADRMLDMGFIHDIRRIITKLPSPRQNLLFAATMPAEIRQLAATMMHQPVSVQVAPVSATADRIDQSVYFVEKLNKPALLAHLVDALPITRAIVFTRTRHGADRLVRQLHGYGIRAEAIHGNKSQNARERALAGFRSEKTPLLVATDIASRGIDIDGVSHVVNFDLSHEPETYVHRIGRTARAGAAGSAVSFCSRDEAADLKAIESLIRFRIPVKTDHPVYAPAPAPNHAPRPSHAPRPHASRPHTSGQGQHPTHRQAPAAPRSGHIPHHEHTAARGPQPRHPAANKARAERPANRPGRGVVATNTRNNRLGY